MRPAVLTCLCLSLALVPTALVAQTPAQDLPPTTQARTWIEQDPTVAEARSARAAAEHAGAAMAASPNEWTARLQSQRRLYRDGAAGSTEWSAQLERPISVNGKTALDRDLAGHDLGISRARLNAARDEAARALASLWIDAGAATQVLALLRDQQSFAEANLAIVEKRQRAGDASTLDVHVARADLVEMQRQVSLANTGQTKAQARLRLRFPGAGPGAERLADPTPLPWSDEQWRERILTEAPALRVAEAQWRKAQLAAARARADRVPDPTVGVYTGMEAHRNERIVGVSLSMPLAGTYREQRMLQALREADAARAVLDRERQLLEIQLAETHADAVGSHERWQVAEQGASASHDAARLMQRAYTLGEADLQALLSARRQSLDAARAALEARVDALHWQHRLAIDAHLIWDLALD